VAVVKCMLSSYNTYLYEEYSSLIHIFVLIMMYGNWCPMNGRPVDWKKRHPPLPPPPKESKMHWRCSTSAGSDSYICWSRLSSFWV